MYTQAWGLKIGSYLTEQGLFKAYMPWDFIEGFQLIEGKKTRMATQFCSFREEESTPMHCQHLTLAKALFLSAETEQNPTFVELHF